MKRRILSLLLAVVMLIGMLPMGVFAAETTDPTVDSTEPTVQETAEEATEASTEAPEETTEPAEETTEPVAETSEPTTAPEAEIAPASEETAAAVTVNVSYTAQAGGAFLLAPHMGTSVSSDLAESYGYSDQVTDGVSTIDVLVAAHIARFGSAFTRETADNYLVVENNFISKICGVANSNIGILVNGVQPHDNKLSADGWYTGYGIEQAKVASGDLVEFFLYQDAAWADNYVWLELADGTRVNGQTVKAGKSVDIYVKGYSPFSYGCKQESEIAANTVAIPNASLQLVNMSTGALTSLTGASDENGKITVQVPSDWEGSYYLTAKGDKTIMSLARVVVEKADESTACNLTALEIAVGGKTIETAVPQTLTPGFAGTTTTYTTPILDYVSSANSRFVLVKASAAEGTTMTAQCEKSEVATLANGEWTLLQVKGGTFFSPTYSGPLNTGKYNTLTITVSAEGETDKVYTVTIPMQPDLENQKLAWKQDLADALYVTQNANASLTVEAEYKNRPLENTDEITYQWYSNTSADTATGTAIEGAVAASYTPSTAATGTTYYYAVASCGDLEPITGKEIAVTVTDKAAPTSVTLVCDHPYTIPNTWIKALGGVTFVATAGDVLNIRAVDENGEDTPVSWTVSANGGSFDKATGKYTISNTAYTYLTATSLYDSSITSGEQVIQVSDYKISSYNRDKSVALSTDGQTVKTASVMGGIADHTIWTYEADEKVAECTTELTKKGTTIAFNLLRPGTIQLSYTLDLGGETDPKLTDSTTLTITGVTVEDAAGKQAKTYLEKTASQPSPTVQLTAYVAEGRTVSGWTSADETVATVDENGKVTAVGIGSTIITATDSEGTKGGIKVVVSDDATPTFENIAFTTGRSGVKTNISYQPLMLEYTGLEIYLYSTSSLNLTAETMYNTEKHEAVATYTDINGESRSISINSGAATALPDIPFGTSTVTITLTDKTDAEKKTVYTFEVSRPRDTSKQIAYSAGIVMKDAEGGSLSSDLYNEKAEGYLFRTDAEGVLAGNSYTVVYSYYNYRTFLLGGRESFTMQIKGYTNYVHMRYSTDNGATWTELPQGSGNTGVITFPERESDDVNAEVKIILQVVSDSVYAENGNAFPAEVTHNSNGCVYTIWAEQIPPVGEAKMLTAQTNLGDWYPAFDTETTSYNISVPTGSEAPVLTYTVSDGAAVKVGDAVQTANEDGSYTLTLTNESQTVSITSKDGEANRAYSFRYSQRVSGNPDKVVDYLPINSQYTNGGQYGLHPESTLSSNTALVSLGNFGGYVTYYYETGLTDNPNHPYGVDFYVYGNAFKDTSTGTGLGSMEPGQVWVSVDGNSWYALAGSEHYEKDTIWNYAVTYSKSGTDGTAWTDNRGNSGSRTFSWPLAENYPMNSLLEKDSFTLSGILIPCVDGTVTGTDSFSSFSSGARFGYADVLSNGTANPYLDNSEYENQSSGFDLAWAVDAAGNPVDVSGMSFHYVKVVTASNIVAGTANEKSTEVGSVTRAAAQAEAVGTTTAPTGVTISDGEKSQTITFEEGKQVYEAALTDMENLSILVNGTAEDDNIYINNQRVASGTAATGITISKGSDTLVRIIVQNGEKEPVIYLLKLTQAVKPTFSNLELYKSTSSYNNGEEPLTITPAFAGTTYEGYTVAAPDYLSSLYAVGTLSEETVNSGWNSYVMFSNSWGGWTGGTVSNGVAKRSVNFPSGYVSIYLGSRTNGEYKVDVAKYATLSGLVIDGVVDNDFNRDTMTYHAYVDGTAGGVSITPTAYKTSYTVTVNGTAVTSGESYTLPYSWDENGKMEAKIEVSGNDVTTATYTVELEKKPLNDAPFVMTQPVEADYTVLDKAEALLVEASANGDLTYQWYYNTTDSNENGTIIEGATESTYTPPITADVIGTHYYYCVVTNTGKIEGNTTASNTARITVDPDPTPVAILTNPGTAMPEDGYEYAWDTGYIFAPGAEAAPLTVTATSAAEGGEWSYTWRSISRPYNNNGWSSLSDAASSSFIPVTTLKTANDTGKYYGCQVTYTFKGKDYTVWATTGDTYTVKNEDGTDGKTYDVMGVYVFLKVSEAATPTLTTQPASSSYLVGDSMKSPSVSASREDGGTLSYQWYENTTDSNEGGTAIEGATRSSYSLGEATEAGTKYYYCVVTNTIQGHTSSVTSEVAVITVKSIEDQIGNRLSGTGTAEDPYLIVDAQDYQDVYDLVAGGMTFEGMYLKQVNDITLPEGWKPIGVLKDPSVGHINSGNNMNAFSGTLDGNGKTVTVPEGGLPLLGYVKGAAVKNLNVYGKRIEGYGLVNHLEGVGLSGEAICIDNVTLKSGSSTLKSGLIGTYITNNGFAGCSAAFYVTIKNCTIEKDVVIGYDKDQSMIGSIAGRIHGTIDNCVSYATVYGINYVGGILGTRDNALSACSVTNSEFHGTVEASGEHVGGIVGGGYSNSTAPNGGKNNINDCTVSGSVTGSNKVGGIVGGDTFVAQLWGAHTLKNNSFTGKVKATGGTYVGGIIGFYDSLNKNDDISGNYYKSGCGADRGIGYVEYVDTSCETHETKIGGTYFNTADGTDECPAVAGCSWRTAHNRTDDPLGADAAKLCYTDSDVDPIAVELTASGSYKTEYTLGEKMDLTGIVLTVVYNDKSTETITLNDVTVTGFDAAKVGQQTLTIVYDSLSTTVTVNVKNPVGEIKVTVSVLGDSAHGSNGTVHTLTTGGLTTWAGATAYTVDSNSTVWDVLQQVFKENGITCSYKMSLGTVYIESLTRGGVTLAELTNGGNSGWMYTLNGAYSELGVAQQYLKDGDKVVFHYTDDYTREKTGYEDDTQDKDAAAAEAVEKLIASIGTVSLNSASRIEEARKAYDALTYAQKKLVGNLAELTAAEEKYDDLKAADDEKKATAVEDLIRKIDSYITLDSEAEIAAARKAYNALTADQKKLVSNFGTLTNAEYDLALLKADEADKEAAQEVIDMIDDLLTITLASEEKIAAARAAYDQLTDTQKALVKNYADLEAAEEKLAQLREAAIGEDIYKATGDSLESLGTPNVGSIGGEWMVIGLARSGREISDAYYDNVASYVLENIDENERLHTAKSTENARMILALTAIGMDVTNVDGHNLLVGLNDMDYIQYQGLNGPIWALIAFDSGNYPVPEGNATRDALIQVILDAQLADGGWTLSGETSDADMTGMAVQALAPYYETNADVKLAVDAALETLSQMQNADGSYASVDGASSESIAQVIVALTALGIDPDTDERFVKNGVSAFDALLTYYVEDGGFKHIPSGNADGMATEQAYYALAAYYRMRSGETALYDMTDVIDLGGDVEIVEPTETLPAQTEPAEVEESTSGSWWWIIIAIIGLGAAIVIVVIKNRKKK